MKKIYAALLGGSAALLVVTSLPASAQEAPLSADESHEEGDSHPEAGAHEEEAGEVLIVQSTRTRRRVQDEPIRVEVITREEIEEKLLMRPGQIAMLVNETPGERVQVTSPALGAANATSGLKLCVQDLTSPSAVCRNSALKAFARRITHAAAAGGRLHRR
jgi:iron complex outermembrane receptor protein